MEYKIGIGYDIHRLVEGRKLFIGGVEIPYIRGLLGHSDADALLHAICDGLLGASGLGDIGERFVDSDPKYHNIASIELLKITAALVKKENYQICNLDTVIIAEEPSLFPFKKLIQENIARALNLKTDCVGIKAKTNEGLDEVGHKEAIACYAVVLLMRG